jgi:hypothetical protein
VDGAKLIWQDVKGLIPQVGIDGDYLTFSVSKDCIAEGNAVIAATADGKVVWSWHVWITREMLTNAIDVAATIGSTTHTYHMAPLNLGQVRAYKLSGNYAGSQCRVKATFDGGDEQVFTVTQPDFKGETDQRNPWRSPYWQWGRKDALLPAVANGTNITFLSSGFRGKDGQTNYFGGGCWFWSNTPSGYLGRNEYPYQAGTMRAITDSPQIVYYTNDRGNGLSVRPVKEKND